MERWLTCYLDEFNYRAITNLTNSLNANFKKRVANKPAKPVVRV